jgi:hypothetical protein
MIAITVTQMLQDSGYQVTVGTASAGAAVVWNTSSLNTPEVAEKV